MKIFIAVPSMDQVPARFAQSLAMLRCKYDAVVGFQMGSLVWDSRTKLSQRAIRCEADYMLWLDSDMEFPPDLLERLMDTLEKTPEADIVTGLYFRRVEPYSPVLFEKIQLAGPGANWKEFDQLPEEPVFEVEGCGFGAVLVPTDVIMSVTAKYGDPFWPQNHLGEDLAFCIRARELGYHIYCDQTIKIGHVGHNVVDRDFYTFYQAQKKIREEVQRQQAEASSSVK